jgi:hypothetical protein
MIYARGYNARYPVPILTMSDRTERISRVLGVRQRSLGTSLPAAPVQEQSFFDPSAELVREG